MNSMAQRCLNHLNRQSGTVTKNARLNGIPMNHTILEKISLGFVQLSPGGGHGHQGSSSSSSLSASPSSPSSSSLAATTEASLLGVFPSSMSSPPPSSSLPVPASPASTASASASNEDDGETFAVKDAGDFFGSLPLCLPCKSSADVYDFTVMRRTSPPLFVEYDFSMLPSETTFVSDS